MSKATNLTNEILKRRHGRDFDCRDLLSLEDPLALYNAPQVEECPSCHGEGQFVVGMSFTPQGASLLCVDCERCAGKGWGFWYATS